MTVHDRQPDTFPWRAAPAHLKTRRQLRAAGLSPGGQDVAAVMVGKRRGRRLIAYLFDVGRARPKRTPSPAQLAAIEKATSEHQARAAARRGYTRTDLTTPTDPGPGWDETTTPKEESMSDTSTGTVPTVEDGPGEPTRLTPTGRGQRLAFLRTVAAVNQARYHREQLDQLVADAEAAGRGEDFQRRLAQQLAEAEDQLAAEDPWRNPHALTHALAEALYWSPGSDLAAARVQQIGEQLAHRWGVVLDGVDPETCTVGIDPAFDAAAAQLAADRAVVRARERAIAETLSQIPMPEPTQDRVVAAVTAWYDAEGAGTSTPHDSDALAARLEELHGHLSALDLAQPERDQVRFTVDYLWRDVRQVDLLDTPVMVDPGQEVRGRVPQLLQAFAEQRIAPAEIGAEISVMTAEDQQAVREAGRAIRAGDEVDVRLWPGYADRDQLREQLENYARDAIEAGREADYLAETDLAPFDAALVGINDDIEDRIERMSASHDQLLAAADTAKGLAPAERHQIRAVLADAEAGVDEDYELPELMWVDERSKAQLDTDRSHRQAAGLAETFCRDAMQVIADGKAQPSNAHTQTLEGVLSTVGDNLYSVASGSVDDAHRTQFVKDRTELGRALTAAGVYDETKADIRELVDTRARQAGKLGRGAVEREQRWKTRTTEILARRDDARAQQHAARTARPRSTKTCATRVDRSAQTTSPAPTGARTAARRHYTPGVER
ncbi:RRQRL motif-containing zinc-binding protein [Nocardia farcinica]|uniref:RRQRL motif-containing zinc-binding protein n=3 Tax=Nocardia farcinica TaxID=37329 RepID=UPI002455FD22|nr:RRQRL motif-containing zinc-binding protein [Nocardia farcinica]